MAFGRETLTNSNLRKGLQTIKCECGTEILLIPDFASMNRAIENHVVEHTKSGSDQAKSVKEKNRIREQLIAKAFEKINASE